MVCGLSANMLYLVSLGGAAVIPVVNLGVAVINSMLSTFDVTGWNA